MNKYKIQSQTDGRYAVSKRVFYMFWVQLKVYESVAAAIDDFVAFSKTRPK